MLKGHKKEFKKRRAVLRSFALSLGVLAPWREIHRLIGTNFETFDASINEETSCIDCKTKSP
jgi:hypothetical protein